MSAEDKLPEDDRDYLNEKGYEFEVHEDGTGSLYVVIRRFVVGTAYVPAEANLMVILPAGYPNAQVDMFWTFPDVKLQNGSLPAASEHHHEYVGRNWQRWSRHFQGWRPGVDSLKTFIAAVRKELQKGI
jgi:hypothetical protein